MKRLNSETSSVSVMACDTNKQFGTDDCGLFALAYALAICLDKNPAQLLFEPISMMYWKHKIHNNLILLKYKVIHCVIILNITKIWKMKY